MNNRAYASRIVLPVITGGVLLLIWELIIRLGDVSPGTFPPPHAVFARWLTLLGEPEYYLSIIATLTTMLAGLGIGVLLGIPLGAVAGMFQTVRFAIWPFVQGIRALPAVALIPIVLATVPGDNGRPILIGIACAAIIAVSCGDGFRSAARERLDFSAMAELRGWRTLIFLYLPEVARELLVGLRIAASLALVLSVVLEMLLGQIHGLGTYISTHSDTDRAAVFAVTLTLAAIGILVNAGIDYLSKAILYWDAY